MRRYALRRLALFPVLLFVIYAGAVLLLMATPGEGLDAGERELSPQVLAARRATYNYDQPWWQRYFWTWPKRLIWDGDLPAQQYPDWRVAEILWTAMPVSLQLGAVGLVLAVGIGLGTGIAAAANRGGSLDYLSVGLSLVGISFPTFVIGSALLLVFALWLRLASVGGWGQPSQVVLPALTLALPYSAYIARLTRGALLEELGSNYIRTARAKGLSEWQILLEHALPNALLPVLSYLGPAAAAMFTGSFVVEKIFVIPGMGTHVVESIHNRDQTLILATVLVYAVLLIGFNLVVDLLYGLLDPRIRVGAEEPKASWASDK